MCSVWVNQFRSSEKFTFRIVLPLQSGRLSSGGGVVATASVGVENFLLGSFSTVGATVNQEGGSVTL